MRRTFALSTILALGLNLLAIPATACTFCGGGLLSRQTLREYAHNSKLVIQGRLKNPRLNDSGNGGSTEFHVISVLKGEPPLGNAKVVVIPKYYPVIGDTPTDYVMFGAMVDGNFDPIHAAPASVSDYVAAVSKLSHTDAARRLAFYFDRLDVADTAIAADAFLEFAKASDTDILKAKPSLSPAKLRKLLTDPNTPADRLGVYALMLGACGATEDAKVLGEMLVTSPLPDRTATNLGGVLAGYTLLNPTTGWATTEAILLDGKRPFAERLAAMGTLRFFQATRPATKPELLRCYRGLIRQGELAELATDDLRRWSWWDLTADVLARYQIDAPPLVRRCVLRYALSCPTEEAKRFVATVRQRDPKLVEDVEGTLRLFK